MVYVVYVLYTQPCVGGGVQKQGLAVSIGQLSSLSSDVAAPYAIFASRVIPMSLPECPSLPGFLYYIALVLSLTPVSLAQCHSCTAGHLPAGCGNSFGAP
jgi:hypothetical protein